MKQLLITVAMLLAVVFPTLGQISDYQKKAYYAHGDTLNYRMLEPSVKNGELYPLVLFLHGLGERGNDNEKQLTWGAQMFLNPINRADYPAYVIMPQCPETSYGAYNERPASFSADLMPIIEEATVVMKMLRELIDKIGNKYPIDKSRIYVMGLSMGGMATYDIVLRNPDLFAVAVPICGTVNVNRITKVDTKWYIFHGDSDPVVPVECSRNVYKKMKEVGNDVQYHEFCGCSHNSWNPAFNSPDFMKNIFSVRRNISKSKKR